MIVILASEYDHSARALAALWADKNVALLTCQDLSSAGWRHYSDLSKEMTAVVQGKVMNKNQIRGVVTRLPYVPEHELATIANYDRTFVAAEMNAFLLSWLSSLDCPVLNSPTPACLCGPNWRQQEWLHVAAELGIPVLPTNCRIGDASVILPNLAGLDNAALVTVVGDRSVGNVDDSLKAQARRLANEARVGLLRVWFAGRERGSPLAGADLWVDIADPTISEAILRLLEEERMRNAHKV